MSPFLLLGLICIAIYSFVSWLVPTVLAWWFMRKFNIQLKIGRIAVPKLIFKDVTLSKDGYSIYINQVSFKSSFFNSEINKLVSVVITDLKITNNVEEKRSVVVETILKPLLSKQNSSTIKDEQKEQEKYLDNTHKGFEHLLAKDVLDFREKKLPQSLIMFAQFMGLHIFNATVIIYNETAGTPCQLLASVAEVHADGAAGGPTKSLIFSASLVQANAHVTLSESKRNILEGSCSLLIEGTVKADGPLNIEKIHASVTKPSLVIQDQMFSFINNRKKRKRQALSVPEGYYKHSASPIERYSPLIPKIFTLKVDTTAVQYENDTANLNFSVQNMQVNSRFSASPILTGVREYSNLPQVYFAFQMDTLKLATDTECFVALNKLKLDAKLEKGVLNLYLILNTLNVTYVHKEAFLLYSRSAQVLKTSKPMEIEDSSKNIAAPSSFIEELLALCSVQGCVELRGAKLTIDLGDNKLPIGCAGLKLKLDQLLDYRESAAWGPAGRQRSAELLLDGGWAGGAGVGVGAGGRAGAAAAVARRHHAWGTAALAVALLKWGTVSPTDSKVEAMMDCLRFEWSPTFAKLIISAIDCLNEYRQLKPETASTDKDVSDQSVPQSNMSINVALSHINIFLISSESVCIMTRIDAVSLEKSLAKYAFVISGLKIVELEPYRTPFPCQRTDDIVTSFFHVKLARVEYITVLETQSRLLDLQSLDVVDMEWTVNRHLKILTLVREIKGFKDRVRDKRRKETGVKKMPLDWRICFKNETHLVLGLSKENVLMFSTDDMTLSYEHEMGFALAWSQLRVIVNDDEILTVDGFSMERLIDDQDIRVERKANEGFVLPWNKVWDVNIDSFRLIFPYKHRFADAVQGDFVSTFKWLKIVHNIQKKPFTEDSPLPSDLYIKVEEVLLEMSDDPFEVKLRDNYELLEDELKESQKRRAMLDAKVQELCKPHLFLPAGKVEELYDALRQKDVEIYIQRCRATPPPRTRLVAATLTRLRLMALADPSLHGVKRAEDKLREIDSDSVWPEEGIEWSWLWARAGSLACLQGAVVLRDFPQPLLSLSEVRLWGVLAAAEQAAPHRAIRTVTIDQGAPYGPFTIERSMMPAKFYYDLCCEMTEMSYAFGPCWEPVIAQCNLAFDQVSRPSLDPSPPLAWWDKVRLLMHGRLTANFRKCTCLLHVSLDPYNTTEEMEVTWCDMVLDWTNGKLGFLGGLNVFVRTASKYDDCRVLRVPALRLAGKLGWRAVGEPRDHHAAAPTAPTRLPEYSSNQEHDSYRAFRSQGLDLHISMDTKPLESDGPELLLYGSTLRWFESLKLILSGITRPTRRGRVFCNVRPRRPQLSRHYRNVSVSLTLHKLQVLYWSSSSMQRGIEMLGARVTCGSKHSLTLVPCNDGLIRRPRANWTTGYMNCDLNDAEIWLKTSTPGNEDKDNESVSSSTGVCMEKCYCLSVRRVSYGREAAATAAAGCEAAAAPTHRLAVHDLRGAWTKLNRDLAHALFDTYIKTQQLKKNLSTKALKEEEKPMTSPKHQRDTDVVSPPPSAANQSGGSGMLLALVAAAGEAGGEAPVVFSDELRGAPAAAAAARPRPLDDDTAHTACLIELVNSQVVLKGCETRGYVILCAARAEVRQRVRRAPAAIAWSGHLAAMQYYATVSVGSHDENIQWVSVEEISERGSESSKSALSLVGSGHSAGGVIGHTVGPSADAASTQLQRIVSRCACEFYYVSQEEPPPSSGSGWPQGEPEPYDSFTLVHHDLDVCTNSLQYAMLLDVVNNVVLHVEPARRRTLERRARHRFQLQLAHTQPRRLLHSLQTQVRESLAKLRRLEKEYYLKNRSMNSNDPAALKELKNLDNQVNECKETVWSLGEELDAMVRAWRESSETGEGGGGAGGGGGEGGGSRAPHAPHAPPHRHNEICFKSARWRLTDADGQLGIADLLLTNFLYTKTSRSDDSVEHQLELGYVQVTNLLPNEPFPEVLVPQAPSGRAPVARRAALRVFCRDRPPVGGISVKEHFEVNIVPFKIGLTKKFFNTMLKFCFPERDPDTIEGMEGEEDTEGTLKPGTSSTSLVSTGSKKAKKKKDSNSNFYVKRDKDKDDVEKMKERAEKNKLFIYIKIPEVPVRVSYKGSKEKNLEDVRDLPLVLPTLEYHNVTWTWLDLLLATKSDTRRVILSQAIRQKLQLHRRAAAAPEPHEEDKARLLLGERTVAENKPQKKNTPGVFKFTKP